MHEQERRRSPRYAVDLPIQLRLVNDETGEVVVGPLSGRLVDISVYGCRLYLKIQSTDDLYLLDRKESAHNYRLQLEIISKPTESGQAATILPVWFDQQDDLEGTVVMGAEFDACSTNAEIPDCVRDILADVVGN